MIDRRKELTSSERWALLDWANENGWNPNGRQVSALEVQAMIALTQCGVTPNDVEQQVRVGKYRIDFAWPDEKIGLEIDGPSHDGPYDAVADKWRDSFLRTEGWLIFRVDHTTDADEMMRQIQRVVVTQYLHREYPVRWTDEP